MKLTSQFAAALLAPLLITAPMRAEMRAETQTLDQSPASQIHISLVERDADTVAAGSGSAKGFTVQVSDSSGSPVGESAVVFRLPDEGASGTFADSAHSAIVYTAADGRARVSGIKWGDTPGSVAIKVTATKGEARAGFLVLETLTPGTAAAAAAIVPAPKAAAPVVSIAQPGISRNSEALPSSAAPPAVSIVNGKTADKSYHSSHKKWIILAAVVAAAAGAGLAVGGKGKSTAATTSTTGVSVGSPSISVGHP